MASGLTGGTQGGGGLMGMVGSLLGGQKGGDAGGLGPLMQMLDANGDGSPLDDILGKFMKR